MSWKRRGAAVLAASAVGAGLFTVATVVAPSRSLPAATSSVAEPTEPADPTGVSGLRARLAEVPGDWPAWSALGDAYTRRAVSTSDPRDYSRAEEAFARSLELRPEGNDGALAGQGALAASRHDFTAALALAQGALSVNPYSAAALGVQVDALVELGRYEEAQGALQQMLDVTPSTASLARASYYRELHGDIPGARLALEDALAFASAPSDQVFALQYLGELAFAHGDPEGALQRYEEGLRLSPDDPALLAARAEARAATGQLAGALEDYEASVARLPDPGHLAEYATALEAAGKGGEAQQQHRAVRDAYRLLQEHGSVVDLDVAGYEAGLGNVEEALAAAQREHGRRTSVHTEDAMAYALHLAGRDEEALAHAQAAERLSGRDAGFAYHRGLIEAALGMPEARATLQRAVDNAPQAADGVAAAAALAAL